MVGGSNPRPPHCERGALPAELTTHSNRRENPLGRREIITEQLQGVKREMRRLTWDIDPIGADQSK